MATFIAIRPGSRYFSYDNGKKQSEYLLVNPDGRQFIISGTTRELLDYLASGKSLEEICDELQTPGYRISTAELNRLLENRYARLGLFAAGDALPDSAPDARAPKASWPFVECGTLFAPERVNAVAAKLSWLYRWPAFAFVALLCSAAHIAVYRGIPHRFLLPHGSALLLLFLALASIVAHEIGHAAAAAVWRS